MIFHLFCLFAISHAFFNISKNMADIYSTLEGDYTQCFRERAAFLESGEDPMTLPKAVIMRDKIKVTTVSQSKGALLFSLVSMLGTS